MVLLRPVAKMVEGFLQLARPDLNPTEQVCMLGVALPPVLQMRLLQPAHFHEQIQRANATVAFQNSFGSQHHTSL
jgi:hypothetical protein